MDEYFFYSKSDCPYCEKIEGLFSQLASEGKIKYSFEKIEDMKERNQIYDSLNLVGNKRTFPQVFAVLDGVKERIGDCSESYEAIKSMYE